MAKNKNKSETQKVTLKMVKTIARSALCLHCTNCLRKHCVADYTRLDQIQAEDQAGFRCTCQAMDHLATCRIVVSQNVGCNNGLHEGVRLHHTQLNLGRPQTLRYRTWIHQPPDKSKNQKATVMTDEESDMFEIQKWDQAGWSSVELALQHCSADGLERRPSTLAKEERNGYSLGRQRSRLPHEYALCWRCAPVCFFERAASKSAVRLQVQHRKGGTQNTSRKDEKFSATKARTVDKKWIIDNIKVEMFTREESTTYLGQTNTFQQQKTTEIKNRIRAAWATFYKS